MTLRIGACGVFGLPLLGAFVVYGLLRQTMGLRLTAEQEYEGADLSIHRIGATPEREVNW